jgi:hypothetical protein
MVDNPSHENELRAKYQKALSPENGRKQGTVESEFSGCQARDEVKVEIGEASVQELNKKFR